MAAIDITFYINNSEERVLNKSLSWWGFPQVDAPPTISGYFREDTSTRTPSIAIEWQREDYKLLYSYNYIYIKQFNAYYSIKDRTLEEANVIRLDCEIDDLMTYRDYIKNCEARVISAEQSAETEVDNGALSTKESSFTRIINFNATIEEVGTYILLTAGPNVAE